MIARSPCRIAVLAVAVAGCSEGTTPAVMTPDLGVPGIPAEMQRAGNPQAGYHALINNGYVSCGLPWSVYSQLSGPAPEAERLPGRDGHNADLAYWLTAFTTKSGVEVVSANCLTCHAGFLDGKLVVGLGAHDRDFTNDTNQKGADLAGMFITDPKEKAEWAKWAERVDAIGPYIQTSTVGVNPADNLAAVLFAHRDRKTLAWSPEPLLPLPPPVVVPVDVPPWWRMKKKTAMFYDAAGRGDHARIMMTASTLCTDSVDEARAIDAYFPDVRAYIASLDPPAWPYAVDSSLALRGRATFEKTCSRCHGTYGTGGAYPNLVIDVEAVGTDATLALGGSQFADRFVKWFNESFYGEKSRLEPQKGYVAPPLDGIWATAPYLHNGSVPTLLALLDSTKRPKYWTRSFDSKDYDAAAVGWNHTALDHGQAGETGPPGMKTKIYDTTLPGYGNGGHTYGDSLSAGDRAAVLEYLKTL